MNAMQLLEDPRFARVGLSLIHFLWQGALLGAAAGMLMILMRTASSRQRYAVLLILLACTAIAPIVTFVSLPTRPRMIDEDRVLGSAVPRSGPLDAPPASLVTVRPAPHGTAKLDADSVHVESTTLVDTARDAGWREGIGSAWGWISAHLGWLAAGWLAGVCLFSVRLVSGLRGARRARRVGVRPASRSYGAIWADLAERLRFRRAVRICESTLVSVPVVVGWLSPMVLLPIGAIANMPEPELRAILAHEIAHIRRQDYLVNVLQTLLETLLFFHPAVWWLSSAIRREREQCCDDLAAEVCGDKIVVAKALVRLAEVRALPAHAALAANGGRLSQRIRRLLSGSSEMRRRPEWRQAADSVVTILLISVVVLAIGTFTVAQESAPKPDSAQASAQETRDGESTKSQPDQPAADVPVLSHIPYLEPLFSKRSKEEARRLQGVWEEVTEPRAEHEKSNIAIIGDTIFCPFAFRYKLDVEQSPKELDFFERHGDKAYAVRLIY